MNKTVDINKPIQFGEDTNYAIDITPHPKKHSQAKYTFFRNGQKIGEYTGRLPLELGATTNIGKEIRKDYQPTPSTTTSTTSKQSYTKNSKPY